MSTSTLIATPAARDEHATLLVGFELGKSSWLIGLHAPELGKAVSRHKVDGGDLGKVLELIAAMRRRLAKLGKPIRVVFMKPDMTGSGCTAHCVRPASRPGDRRRRACRWTGGRGGSRPTASTSSS